MSKELPFPLPIRTPRINVQSGDEIEINFLWANLGDK